MVMLWFDIRYIIWMLCGWTDFNDSLRVKMDVSKLSFYRFIRRFLILVCLQLNRKQSFRNCVELKSFGISSELLCLLVSEGPTDD